MHLLLSSAAAGIWEWDWQPSVLIGLAAWSIAYILLIGPIRQRKGWGPSPNWTRQAAFHLGSLVTLFALVSPLDHLGDEYLLTAHMIQHLLLLLVAPPLWLMGVPQGWLDELILPGFLRGFLRWVTRPITAFLIFNAVLLAWHIPSMYDAALSNENIHILEHLMFLGSALIGWWPVLGFLPEVAPRASYPAQLLYLFVTMVSATGLGAIITLATSPIYPFYLDAPRLWGLSVMADQQIAGLIMWVPGNMFYFAVFMYDLYVWFQDQERREKKRAALEGISGEPIPRKP